MADHQGISRPMCRFSNAACTMPPGNVDARPRLLSVGSTVADAATAASTTALAESSGSLNDKSNPFVQHITFTQQSAMSLI